MTQRLNTRCIAYLDCTDGDGRIRCYLVSRAAGNARAKTCFDRVLQALVAMNTL